MNLPGTVAVTFHAVTAAHPHACCDPLPAASHMLSQALGLQLVQISRHRTGQDQAGLSYVAHVRRPSGLVTQPCSSSKDILHPPPPRFVATSEYIRPGNSPVYPWTIGALLAWLPDFEELNVSRACVARHLMQSNNLF